MRVTERHGGNLDVRRSDIRSECALGSDVTLSKTGLIESHDKKTSCIWPWCMSMQLEESFTTELAGGRGSASIAMTVTGQSMVTRITLWSLCMTETHEPAKPVLANLSRKRPWRALWNSVPTPCNSVSTAMLSWLRDARGSGFRSVVVAGHTGHSAPFGRSVLKWARSWPLALAGTNADGSAAQFFMVATGAPGDRQEERVSAPYDEM